MDDFYTSAKLTLKMAFVFNFSSIIIGVHFHRTAIIVAAVLCHFAITATVMICEKILLKK